MKKTLDKKIIISTFAILLFLFILRDVFVYEVTFYDKWIYSTFVESSRSNEMTLIMQIITSLGSGVVLVSFVILMYILMKNKNNSYLALINLGMISLINNIIKIIVKRPRPEYGIITETNYSFPSGHATAATAFYGFLIYLIYINVKNKKLKYFLIALMFIIIVSICVSRIYLGVHYFSDTLAGFAFSIAYLMLFITITSGVLKKLGDNNEKKEKKKN